jgi:hypothetical protein
MYWQFRRGLDRCAWIAAVLAMTLMTAPRSHAGILTTDFDLSGSSLALGTLLQTPNGTGSSVVRGNARVVLDGVDARGMLSSSTATVRIQGLNLTFNVNQPITAGGSPLPNANFVGPVRLTQIGLATGRFDGMNAIFDQNSLTLGFAVNLDCQGSICPQIIVLAAAMGLQIPIVRMFPLTNPSPFSLTLTNLGSGRNGMLSGVFEAMNMGQAVRLNLRGKAPEPIESGMVLLGLLALAAASRFRRVH